jgi:hypothetical protein
MGFTRVVLPFTNAESGDAGGQAELIGVRSVGEALDLLLT